MSKRELLHDHPAHRRADKVHPREVEAVEEGQHVAGNALGGAYAVVRRACAYDRSHDCRRRSQRVAPRALEFAAPRSRACW